MEGTTGGFKEPNLGHLCANPNPAVPSNTLQLITHFIADNPHWHASTIHKLTLGGLISQASFLVTYVNVISGTWRLAYAQLDAVTARDLGNITSTSCWCHR